MSHFLLVYDRRAGHLRDIVRFEEDEHETAVEARFEREEATRNEPDVEVLLLSGTSAQALRRTHGRYFSTLAELAHPHELDDELLEAAQASIVSPS